MASDILEKFVKERLAEKDMNRIWVMIRAAKDVTELRAKDEFPGVVEVRVHDR